MERYQVTELNPADWANARLYAFVERLEFPRADNPSDHVHPCAHAPESDAISRKWTVVVLDAIDADWADRNLPSAPTEALSVAARAPVALFTLDFAHGFDERFAGLELSEQMWLELELGATGSPATLFTELDGASARVNILRIDRLSYEQTKKLSGAIGLDFARDAQPQQLVMLFDSRTCSHIAVYNVGQGNCNAVVGHCAPEWYFDFGGGCLANTRTYPTPLRFCFTNHPPIVLSHWDFDHWFSAIKVPRALTVPWIAPRQKIGPRTWKFASELFLRGSLNIWGDLEQLTFEHGQITRSTGPTSDKNNSGLTALLQTDAGETALLPGDAAYGFIRGCPNTLDGLVAMHHGSHRHLVDTPRGSGRRELAYSYGLGNTYEHPTARARSAYTAANWPRAADTTDGHLALLSAGEPRIGCGGSECDLQTIGRRAPLVPAIERPGKAKP